jgi:phenylacetate-CoA ligase
MFAETALSLDALRSLQLERLRGALRHAYDNQAPYRVKCQAAQVHPDDLRKLDDLGRFPFTAKADLRDAYPYGMFAIPREKCVRIHASSGTTGRPTVVGYSARDIELWADLMARSLHAGGARPGDVIHNAYGYGLFTGGLGAHYGAERLGCTVVPMSGGFGERQVQLIAEFGARVVLMTPATCWRSPTSSSARASIRATRLWRSASSAPSRGPRACAPRSSGGWASMPSTSTA